MAEIKRKNISRERTESMKRMYPKGTRIKLIQMNDPQAPPAGTKGTVTDIDDIGTIFVAWDNGSHLGLICGEDRFQVIRPEELRFCKPKAKRTTEL